MKNHGRQKHLSKILAPHHLALKIDCPVLLLRNLGGNLVNGLQGHVCELNDDNIVVFFDSINETHKIQRYNFTVHDIKKKVNIAERYQFPLQVAYGLTIHKSQGMTMECVVVHCDGIFLPGQLSVAIGRAKSSEGLQVLNYRKGLCPQPKTAVTFYYGIENEEFGEWATECCRNFIFTYNMEHSTCVDSDDTELDHIEFEELEKIDISDIPLLPSAICINEILKTVIRDPPLTAQQININSISTSLSKDFVEIFLAKQYSEIKGIMMDKMRNQSTSTPIWTSVYTSYHQYVTSEAFNTTIPILFQYNSDVSNDQRYSFIAIKM